MPYWVEGFYDISIFFSITETFLIYVIVVFTWEVSILLAGGFKIMCKGANRLIWWLGWSLVQYVDTPQTKWKPHWSK